MKKEDLDEMLARLRRLGAQLVGEVVYLAEQLVKKNDPKCFQNSLLSYARCPPAG